MKTLFPLSKEITGTFCHDALITCLFSLLWKQPLLKLIFLRAIALLYLPLMSLSTSHSSFTFYHHDHLPLALFCHGLLSCKKFWYTKLNINNSNFSLKQFWLSREYDNKDLFVWLCIPLLTFCCDVITGEPDRLVVYEDRLVVWGRDFMGRVLHLHAAGIRGKRRLVSTVQGSQLPPTCQDPKPTA